MHFLDLNKFLPRKVFQALKKAKKTSGVDSVYIVGGAVRDMLLKKIPILDVDIVVNINACLFSKNLSKILNSHIVYLGKNPTTYRIPFPPPGPAPSNLLRKGWMNNFCIDVTEYQESIEQDLKRRDFTVDAIAVEFPSCNIIDATGGLQDIKKGLLKVPREDAFLKDPVRIIRLFSIGSSQCLLIDKKTKILAKRALNKIKDIPAERIRQELLRLFGSKQTYSTMNDMTEMGAWNVLLPESIKLRKIKGGRFHRLSVWKHSIEALKYFDNLVLSLKGTLKKKIDVYLEKKGWILRFAILIHDIGKPDTRKYRKGKGYTFYGHESTGEKYCQIISKRFKLSNDERYLLKMLVKMHMRAGHLAELNFPKKGIRRFFKDAGPDIIGLCLVSVSDLGSIKPLQAKKVLKFLQRVVSGYYDTEKKMIEPFLRGRDILSMGLKQGPVIGQVLKKIQDMQIQGKIKTRKHALEWCKKITAIPFYI